MDVTAVKGDIEIQIIQPKMNKIDVKETNNYVIDADYKLKNPVIKIKSTQNSTVKLYMDGTFQHNTKTKNQYLNEIYSDNYFPNESEIDNSELQFKVNFKKEMTSSTFRDVIGNNIGYTYNNATLRNFNKFEDGAYVRFGDVIKPVTDKDFTFNFWFKSFEDTTSRQYLVYKRQYIEIYIYKGKLCAYIDRFNTVVADIEPGRYYMFTMCYSNSTTQFYIDNILKVNLSRRWTFTGSSQSVYFGTKAGSYNLRSAEIGEVNYYTYHLSHGLVNKLYLHNNPDTQFKDLSSGAVLTKYNNLSSLDINSSYEKDILLKEVARIDNIISTSTVHELKCTDTSNLLKVFDGYIYIPEDGKYTFSSTYDNKFCLTIDSKEVLLNQNTKTYYIEEGYYKFELVTEDIVEILYAKKGETLSTPLIFNESSVQAYINLDNRTSTHNVIFDNRCQDLFFEYGDFTKVQVQKDFFNNQFTFSLKLKTYEDNAQIFAIGEEYNENFKLQVQNNKLVLVYQNGWFYSSTKLDDTVQIDITSNGSKIFLYINGILDFEGYFSTSNISNYDLYFGTAGNGSIYSWFQGDFKLENVIYTLKYSTPQEIINNFIGKD